MRLRLACATRGDRRIPSPAQSVGSQLRDQSNELIAVQVRYQPFYCEENIWWLCAEPPSGVSIEQVIFVASPSGVCPIAEQRDGGAMAWLGGITTASALIISGASGTWIRGYRCRLPPVPGSIAVLRMQPSCQRRCSHCSGWCPLRTTCTTFAAIGAICAVPMVVGFSRRRHGRRSAHSSDSRNARLDGRIPSWGPKRTLSQRGRIVRRRSPLLMPVALTLAAICRFIVIYRTLRGPGLCLILPLSGPSAPELMSISPLVGVLPHL